jgi:hypothetical protein
VTIYGALLQRVNIVCGLLVLSGPAALGAQTMDSSVVPHHVLQIVVRDVTRGPLFETSVVLLDDKGRITGLPFSTNVNGETRIPLQLLRERVQLRIRRIGYVPQTLFVLPDTVHGAVSVALRLAPVTLEQVCTHDMRPGIIVRLAGAVLQESVTVRAVAKAGRYEVSSSGEARTLNSGMALAHERPGTYAVTVTAAGYRVWRRGGIRVPAATGGCHYVGLPRVVEAELIPRR